MLLTNLTPRILIMCLAFAITAVATKVRAGETVPFDHYLLALSWSPTYCRSSAAAGDGLQCGSKKRFAFIVHGLWPQYRTGWPEFCSTPDNRVPDDIVAEMLPLMPSRDLIVHQWRKHGSCSGLPMAEYFALTKSLFDRVRIPARYLSPTASVVTSPREIVSDFVKSNSGLAPAMISLRCGVRKHQARLSEVHICFAFDGSFTACSPAARKCKVASLLLPPARAASMTTEETAE